MEVKFLRAAKIRLAEIWDYSERTWGEAQADKYIRELFETIEKAAEARETWRPLLDEYLHGVYFVRYKRHFIFFRELSPRVIGVVSILLESMNIPMRLREDVSIKE